MLSTQLTILQGDVIEQLKTLPDASVQCVVTSPPYYGLRSYLKADDPAKVHEIGCEETPQQYVDRMVEVFREVRRVLREDGVLWLNLGDSYARDAKKGQHKPGDSGKQAYVYDRGGGRASASLNLQSESKGSSDGFVGRADRAPVRNGAEGFKPKDLLMIPARVAMALQADGWYLRSVCPWIKRNGMPESVKDRPSQTIESVFMLTKSERYFYDAEAVKTPSAHGGKIVQIGEKSFSKGQAAGAGIAASGNGTKDTYTVPAKRTRRAGDWFFESWQGLLQDEEGDPLAFVVNTKPYRAAHFATFPVDLVEPCVKAGVSAHGACPECGTPFSRVIERTTEVDESAKGSRFDAGKTGGRDGGDRTQSGERYLTKAVGWKPGCEHTHTHTHTHTGSVHRPRSVRRQRDDRAGRAQSGVQGYCH